MLLGCVTLLFAGLAIPKICQVKTPDGELGYCRGHLYEWFSYRNKDFSGAHLMEIRMRVLLSFHIMAFVCGTATVIMIIVALCTELTTNITYMVAALVLAALTTLELLVAAIVMTFLLQQTKEWETDDRRKHVMHFALEYYGTVTHAALFWTAFAISTAALICFILAFTYLTEEYKMKGRKTETMRGKSAGKTRGRGRGKSAVKTKDRSRGKSAAETKKRMRRK